jgi:hypothetical protein
MYVCCARCLGRIVHGRCAKAVVVEEVAFGSTLCTMQCTRLFRIVVVKEVEGGALLRHRWLGSEWQPCGPETTA